MPSEDKAEAVIKQLKDKTSYIEYPCIGNIPIDGKHMVYEILVSAPQMSGEKSLIEDEIAFLCALHSFRAQFGQCCKLAHTRMPTSNF